VERERKMSVKKTVLLLFWVVMLCRLVARDQGLKPEDGDNSALRNDW
jgi:hypothetical protein